MSACYVVDTSKVDYIYKWSIDNPHYFWKEVWDFCQIKYSQDYEAVLRDGEDMSRAKWFPGARLNFAENLLRFDDDRQAIVFWGEEQVRRSLTFPELRAQVARMASGFKSCGIRIGDRVAAFMPNMPETIIAMLAASSIGAVWSSCSPDFGVSGVVDRFGQIAPKVLVGCDSYFFKGAQLDCCTKLKEIAAQIPSIEKVVVVPYTTSTPAIDAFPKAVLFDEFLGTDSPPLYFEQLPFDHPLAILYSSGTTGKPKCIVHGAGGTLIEHLKEHSLHTDITQNDRFFYQTTCGWMMWNWLVSGLASGATLILYDGSPFQRGGKILFDLAQEERITVFGTNAKYLAAVEKEGLRPGTTHDLSAMKTMLSTGSPLLPESFDFVYRDIKQDLCLSSISGGTDIIGCFALGCPALPVYRGELQMRSLGLRVEVFNEQGKSVVGERGELVCTAAFPSMPIYFWDDPAGEKYRKAYFEKNPGIWTHGDYVELNDRGGMSFFGRSDAVLNPGGIRIGTAEIYRQVELLPEILESLVIGQQFKGDERIILFVRLREGERLTDALRDTIKQTLRKNASPHHVPKKIIEVKDIPRTKSGKIVELAVRDIIHGKTIQNREALANPESLDLFRNLKELEQE